MTISDLDFEGIEKTKNLLGDLLFLYERSRKKEVEQVDVCEVCSKLESALRPAQETLYIWKSHGYTDNQDLEADPNPELKDLFPDDSDEINEPELKDTQESILDKIDACDPETLVNEIFHD